MHKHRVVILVSNASEVLDGNASQVFDPFVRLFCGHKSISDFFLSIWTYFMYIFFRLAATARRFLIQFVKFTFFQNFFPFFPSSF